MTTTETTRSPWWLNDKFAKAVSGEKPVTSKRAVTLAGANWSVEKHPLYALASNDESSKAEYIGPVGDHFGLLREDTKALLGVVGARYQPIQNTATARWAEEIAAAVRGKLVGSWAPRDGKVFGLTIEPHFAALKVTGEVFEPFLHVLNWHGDGALEAHLTFVSSDTQVNLHTGEVFHARNTSQVNEVKAWAGVQWTDFEKAAHELATRPANQKTLLATYAKLWPKPGTSAGVKSVTRWKNRQAEILAAWEDVSDEVRGSAWGVYLAINNWAQLHRPFRGSGGDPVLQEKLRAEEILMGHAREISESAFDHLVKAKK